MARPLAENEKEIFEAIRNAPNIALVAMKLSMNRLTDPTEC